jgi:hypothetical protein
MSISPDQIRIFRDNQKDVLKSGLTELEVKGYFSVIFSPKGIKSLTKQDMTGFLSFKQNKRWREISRDDVTTDMEALRNALTLLIDESVPISQRLNRLEPNKGDLSVAHLGKAKLSPILLIVYPKKYGVWNDYSQRVIENMGLMPIFSSGMGLGDRYALFNDVLLSLAKEYNVSLWRLDILLEQISRLIR